MKLVLVSDLHGQSKTLKYLAQLREKEAADAVIICGDITADNLEFWFKLIEILDDFPEVFVVGGNADLELRQEIDGSKFSINEKCRPLVSHKFCGLSFPEESLAVSSELAGAIFVTHRPPVAKLLKKEFKNSPKYHISGHLHRSAFVKKYPSTTHIQVPTLQDGRYATFDPDSGIVEFKNI